MNLIQKMQHSNRRAFADLTGKKFGRLLVLGLDHDKEKIKVPLYWLCICDCGTKRSVKGSSLTTITRSCGCLQKENSSKRNSKRLPLGEKPFNDLFLNYKRRAKNILQLPFELSKEEFKELCLLNCYYCDLPPSNVAKSYRNKSDRFQYSGVDRVNPEVGYIKSNCVSCCSKCNYAKLDFTQEEFFNWVELLYKSLKFKGKI